MFHLRSSSSTTQASCARSIFWLFKLEQNTAQKWTVYSEYTLKNTDNLLIDHRDVVAISSRTMTKDVADVRKVVSIFFFFTSALSLWCYLSLFDRSPRVWYIKSLPLLFQLSFQMNTISSNKIYWFIWHISRFKTGKNQLLPLRCEEYWCENLVFILYSIGPFRVI